MAGNRGIRRVERRGVAWYLRCRLLSARYHHDVRRRPTLTRSHRMLRTRSFSALLSAVVLTVACARGEEANTTDTTTTDTAAGAVDGNREVAGGGINAAGWTGRI